MSPLFKEIIKFNKVSSTNDTASENAIKKNDNFVIIASEQISGRGQRGKDWDSPLGGLWFSMCYFINKNINPFVYSVLINNAIIKAIKSMYANKGIELKPKWPNDIYANGKKLCGILIEGIPNEYYIIGVGINTNNKTKYKNAISLNSLINKPVDNEKLLRNILKHFENVISADYEKEFLNWKNNNILLNKKVKIKGRERVFEGIVTHIKSTGELLLDNTQEIHSGEILSFE